MAKMYHRDILKIVKRWKLAKMAEATTSANVGSFQVPLGMIIRPVTTSPLYTRLGQYFRKKKRR